MWVDLLSMVAIGVLVACLIYIAKRSFAKSGRTLPRWILPATIGLGMISYSVWNEYTWYERVTSALPDSVALISQGERSNIWAPWTYLWPVTVRFMAMDTRNQMESEIRPGLVVTEVLLVERWQPTRRIPMAFDCHHRRRADLFEGARVSPDGQLAGTQWHTMAADDPLMHAVCTSRTAT